MFLNHIAENTGLAFQSR